MKRSWRMMVVILVGMGLFLGGFPAAYGEEEEEEKKRKKEVFTLEEMVVTAQKREQELIEVPMSVMAFTGEYMEQTGLHDYESIIYQIPSAQNDYRYNQGAGIYLRGTGITQVGKGDAVTGYYLDESSYRMTNYQHGPPMNAMFDVDRVEVLYGPSGTVYGQGSVGGTIKIITKDVDLQSVSGKAQVEYSSTRDARTDNYRGDAVLNVPIIKDKLGIRVIAGHQHIGSVGTVADHPDWDDANEIDTSALRVKVKWQPTDTLSIGVSHWSTEFTQKMMYSGWWQDRDNLILYAQGDFLPINDSEFKLTSLTVKWDLPFATLISNTARITAATNWNYNWPVQASWDPEVTWMIQRWIPGEVEGTNHETRLVSSQDTPLKWLAGVYYAEDQSEVPLIYNYIVPENPVWNPDKELYRFTPRNFSTARAVFGEVSYDLLDGKLVALAGLRWWQDTRRGGEWIGHGVEFRGEEVFDFTFDTGDKDFDGFNPRFNIVYYPSDDGMVYLNVAKGVRSGFIHQVAGADQLVASGYEGDEWISDADYVWSYEVGSKWALFDGSLIAMGAVFHSNYYDMIAAVEPTEKVTTPDGSVQNYRPFVNAGDFENWGVEWNFIWRPLADLSFTVAGSWLKGEWTAFKDNPAWKVVGNIVEGEETGHLPKWQHNLSATYTRPLGGSGYELFTNATYSWKDKTKSNGSTTYYPDGSSIFYPPAEAEHTDEIMNAQIGLRKGNWSVWLFGRNILDQDEGINAGSAGNNAGGYVPYPRTIGMTVRAEFGGASAGAERTGRVGK